MARAHVQKPRRFLGSRAGKVALVVMSLLSLLSLEVVARLVYAFKDTVSQQWSVLSRDVGWTRRPNFDGRDETGSPRQFDDDGLLAIDGLQIVESDRPRVVFIGDSVTYGYAVDTPLTFVERVDAALPGIDAINLGVMGYTSVQGYETFVRDAIPLEPALVLFAFNYNDRRYVLREAYVDGPARFASQYIVHKLRRYLFVYRWMQDVISRASPPTNRVRLDHLPARVEPDRYRRQLEGVAARAREHGIDLVFLMFGDNPTHTYDLDRGMALHASGHLDEAIRNLEIAVSHTNFFSDVARLQLAEAYKQMGRADDVEAVLTTQPRQLASWRTHDICGWALS